MHRKKNVVCSKSGITPHNDVRYIQTDLEENVQAIKNQYQGDIWLYDGGKLITSMVNAGLVDDSILQYTRFY
ncbi:MAG: hypothetical protein R2806_22500 [Saprospiraceae bacterium]